MNEEQILGPNQTLIEQYKVVREGIEQIHDDRNFHSRQYSTWLAALATGYGLVLISSNGSLSMSQTFMCASISISGTVLSLIWFLHGRIFSDNLRARYKSLKKLEKNMEYKIFTDEPNERAIRLSHSKFVARTPLIATLGFLLLFVAAITEPWNRDFIKNLVLGLR